MGYTHYFPQNKSFTDDQWANVQNGVRKILAYCEKQGIVLQYEYNVAKPPSVTDSLIRFNGVEDEGHETFLITKERNSDFLFCKTAYKPYDLAVCLTLLLIQEVAPGVLLVSSDGDDEDWKPARETFKQLFSD